MRFHPGVVCFELSTSRDRTRWKEFDLANFICFEVSYCEDEKGRSAVAFREGPKCDTDDAIDVIVQTSAGIGRLTGNFCNKRVRPAL